MEIESTELKIDMDMHNVVFIKDRDKQSLLIDGYSCEAGLEDVKIESRLSDGVQELILQIDEEIFTSDVYIGGMLIQESKTANSLVDEQADAGNSIFEGMTFKKPPVSLAEYRNHYYEYLKRTNVKE